MPSEHQLSEVLSDFARTMVTDFPIQGILDQLVLRIVDILPITAAGVTLISPDSDPRYVAASNEAALRFEQLQTELGEGPCLEAYQTGEAVAVPDLRDDRRFPRFGPRALVEGLVAVFTFPLRHGDAQLGALDLYRDEPGLMDTRAMTAAQTLADVVAAYLLNAQARVDLRESSERSLESSRHDALTGVANRIVLLERLEQALLRDRRSARMAAILFVDLDDFKMVNDVHGHHIGDELLLAVAGRLSGLLRPGDTLARLSGDEFVVLCENLIGQMDVDAVAARITAAFDEPFVLSIGDLDQTASIGIAVAGTQSTAKEVLRSADTAMYAAKQQGKGRRSLFDPGMYTAVADRIAMKADLRRAIHEEAIDVHYQPIVDLGTGRIVALEALGRWVHAVRGTVEPEVFVHLAEETGLVPALDALVLRRACAQVRAWQEAGSIPVRLAVNMSARNLKGPQFVAGLARILRETDLDPHLLDLELTESIAIAEGPDSLEVLSAVRALGVGLAIDDFGTGYSVMSRLDTLPFTTVKIDGAFVARMTASSRGASLVQAMTAMARSLDLVVVAEGVETAQQAYMLREYGCHLGQGFLLGRPAAAAAIGPLLRPPVDGLEELVRPLLSELERVTGIECIYLTEIHRADDVQEIRFAHNAATALVSEGLRVDWIDAMSRSMLVAGLRRTGDVPRNYPDSVDSDRLGLRTFVSVPVLLSSQTVWGTLCGASRADVAVDENTVALMERFAELISHRLESTLGPPMARDIDGRRARLPTNGVHRPLPSP